MRWGNDNEMIVQKAEELVDIVNNIITNPHKDINYIDGANHSYDGKEEELAKQIVEFIKSIWPLGPSLKKIEKEYIILWV